MRVGIDAWNVRMGGGLTYVVEVLGALRPEEHGVERVVVWGSRDTLARIAPRPWLELLHQPLLDGPLPARVFWKHSRLDALAREGCDILFVPGGTYLGSFRPFVAVSQNLLPFDPPERARYGASWAHARMLLLERTQAATFRSAAATIFMSETNRRMVEERMGPLPGPAVVVPYGISRRFQAAPRPQEPLEAYTPERPFRWLYVSTVDFYKHPWHLARAVGLLRARRVPTVLELAGPLASPAALRRLEQELAEVDPRGEFVRYLGAVPYAELPGLYRRADGFAYASTCETFGQTLVEAMSAGLPVACSGRSTMPELLGGAGVYFDPEDPEHIADTLHALLLDRALRERNVAAAARRAAEFTWERCARDTFAVIAGAFRAAEREAAAAAEPAAPPARLAEERELAALVPHAVRSRKHA